MKEKFLQIETKEEYLERKAEFKELKADKEVVGHLSKLFGKLNTTDEEVFKTRPEKGKKRIIGQ